jgi:hypothetical protein
MLLYYTRNVNNQPEIAMTQQHVDVYALIAQTSRVMKSAMAREGKPSYPNCIDYAQTNMAGKISCADAIEFMQSYIAKYDR